MTTQPVVLEIGNAPSKQRYRASAVRLIASLLDDPNVENAPFPPNNSPAFFGSTGNESTRSGGSPTASHLW